MTMVRMAKCCARAPEFRLVRNGRFLVAELLVAHRVISTSVRNGGQREGLTVFGKSSELRGDGSSGAACCDYRRGRGDLSRCGLRGNWD